jgi:hypothetical protein
VGASKVRRKLEGGVLLLLVGVVAGKGREVSYVCVEKGVANRGGWIGSHSGEQYCCLQSNTRQPAGKETIQHTRNVRVIQPEAVLLGKHDLAVTLRPRAVLLQRAQASLVDVADARLLGIGPFREGLQELRGGRRVGLVEEIAARLVGEHVGLLVHVEHLEEQVGGGARHADEEDPARGGRLVAVGRSGHADRSLGWLCIHCMQERWGMSVDGDGIIYGRYGVLIYVPGSKAL